MRSTTSSSAYGWPRSRSISGVETEKKGELTKKVKTISEKVRTSLYLGVSVKTNGETGFMVLESGDAKVGK